MADLTIRRINEVWLQVDCEESTRQELSDFFTVKQPGRHWRWDGIIKLYNRRFNRIYVGLWPYLKQFISDSKYTADIPSDLGVADEFSVIEGTSFVARLNIMSHGHPLEARDYQLEPFIYGIRGKRMLLESPTSSGKSFIQYIFARYLFDVKKCRKGLLCVPTVNLVEQMYSDFKDYSSANGWPVHEKVHRIYEGQAKDTNKQLVISTWQSIQDQPIEWFAQFDFVLGDEAHLFKAKSLKYIMTSLVNAKYRIGLTGTLDGSQTHKMVLEGLFGRHKKVISTKELMDRGQVAKLTVKAIFLRYDRFLSAAMLDSHYDDEMDFLCASKQRNRFIANLALSLKGNTLILYQYVEKHGAILEQLLREKAPDRKIYYVHGGVNVATREQIRGLVEADRSSIILASYGTFQLGVSIKRIDNIILASPSKSRIRVLQSIGRGLRIGNGKEECTLFDIVDDFSEEGRTNTTLDHFQERFKYYTEEKFEYKLYTVQLQEEF